jgi:double zinc ribbon protein
MSKVERMYRHLVRTVRTKYTPLLTQPFEVGELYQTILPYRLHRRELGLETNQDYELTLLELLSGAHGYLVVDDRMRDTLAAQLTAAEPDVSLIRKFASEHVAFAPEALHRLEADARATGAQAVVRGSTPQRPRTGPTRTGSGAMPAIPFAPTAGLPNETHSRRTPPPMEVASGELCLFCKGELPAGRQISFCPHCGQDLTVLHCPACGGELERGWKFCVTCGRTAGDG